LQKIALKRTGGEKTDEVLGRKGGPEGLPDSIIVTAEGVEGDAPVMPQDERTAAPPEAEPALPTLAKGKAAPVVKGKKVNVKPKSAAKGRAPEQTVLPFVEKAGAGPKNQKTGKKHGAKKAKK